MADDSAFGKYTATGAATGATIGSSIPGVGTLLGAGIGAGAGLLGDTVNYFTNRHNYKQDRDYNSPKNQMARYKEAGLNPNLIYGEAQGVSAGNADPQQGSASFGDNMQGMSKVGSQLAMQSQQLRNETKLADASSEKQHAEAEKIRQDTTQSAGTYDALLEGLQKDNLSKQQQIEYQELVNKYYPKVTEAQIAQAKALTSKYYAEIRQIAQLIKTGKAQEALLDAQKLAKFAEIPGLEADSDFKQSTLELRKAGELQKYNTRMYKNQMLQKENMYYGVKVFSGMIGTIIGAASVMIPLM